MSSFSRLFASLGVLCCVGTAVPVQATSSDAAAIARVENGLMTAVTIKGQPPQHMTLASRMRYYNVPSVSIAFFDKNGVIWTRAYGASPDTLFQAGSISKPVSAVGIMRLVQAHRLSLDENVNDELRSWKVPQNSFTAAHPVTLRELLSHIAGMTVHGFEGYERGKPLPTLEQVLDGKPPANSPPVRVAFTPGTKYQYSGGGYVVAEQLVLDTVHEPFAKYMHDSVLAPLGMTDSTFEQPLPRALWSRAAVASDGNGKAYPGNWNVYPEQTAAGLWTTPTDLAKFMIGMQNALDGKPGAILSAATAHEMLTPVKDDYGLGFESLGTGSTARFGHNGANVGFQADVLMHRGGEGVAIMTDSDNGSQLMGELMNSIAAVYGWREFTPKQKALYAMPAAQLPRFTGTYDMGGGISFTIYQRGSALYAHSPLGPDDRLYPESPNTFFVLSQDLDFQFAADASGAVDAVKLMQYGVVAKKLPPAAR